MERIKTHYKILLAHDEPRNIIEIIAINYKTDHTLKKPNNDSKRNRALVQKNSYSVLSTK